MTKAIEMGMCALSHPSEQFVLFLWFDQDSNLTPIKRAKANPPQLKFGSLREGSMHSRRRHQD